jgi:hypothetical protein
LVIYVQTYLCFLSLSFRVIYTSARGEQEGAVFIGRRISQMQDGTAMKCTLSMFVLALLVVAIPAIASSNLTLVGVNGASQGGVYVNPYFGSFDSGNTVFTMFCDDLSHEVIVGQAWPVNIINGANASGGRFFASIGQVGYDELFWLSTQYTLANKASWGDISEAGWDIASPGAFSSSSVLSWLGKAEANYGSINPADFEILVPVGGGQEMTTTDPLFEPSTISLLVGGGLGILVVARKRRLGLSRC